MLPTPSAVLLDLDETLLDTQVGLDAGISAAWLLARESFNGDEERWRSANQTAANRIWSTRGQDWVLGRVQDADLTAMIYADTLSLVGAPTTLAPALASVHGAAVLAAARCYGDAPALLAALSDRQVPVGIVTNGAVSQRDLVTAAAIDVPPHQVVVSAEHGRAKPDPALFDIACAALRVDRTRLWHVGDSLSTDVAGARAAGVSAVWIDRRGRSAAPDGPTPDLTISTLDELVERIGN
ncbi:HAD family hydrolase [Isoptericola sp. NPDC056134]|uniref:HAD family hydrolase n=1 Tax=Isoptericola sp. NPDC056134 TaxID=3345723 RepID=UPI0035E5636E